MWFYTRDSRSRNIETITEIETGVQVIRSHSTINWQDRHGGRELVKNYPHTANWFERLCRKLYERGDLANWEPGRKY